jgi:F-type H+-transporting ATPase subunit b
MRLRKTLALTAVTRSLAGLFASAPALAQHGVPGQPAQPPAATPHGARDPRNSPHTPVVDGHGKPHDPHGSMVAGEHGGAHHELLPINWTYGLFGEKEGVEASLFWRPKGMPVPFLANLINFGVLAFLAFRYGKKPLADGLQKRRDTLMQEIDEAAKVKGAAEKRLAEYKKKMKTLDSEVERIRKESAEEAKREEERIVREAKEKRERMRRDAQFLLEQEQKGLQQALLAKTVDQASAAAEKLLVQRLSAADQDRLAEDYLRDIGKNVQSGGVA